MVLIGISHCARSAERPRFESAGVVVVAEQEVGYGIGCPTQASRVCTPILVCLNGRIVVSEITQVVRRQIPLLNPVSIVESRGYGVFAPNQGERVCKLPHWYVAGCTVVALAAVRCGQVLKVDAGVKAIRSRNVLKYSGQSQRANIGCWGRVSALV